MIRYLCDVKNCKDEAGYPENSNEWTSQEMFTPNLDNFPYFWARVGFANITLCKKHRAEAMEKLVEMIKEKYLNR
jgi:hypothetical protein